MIVKVHPGPTASNSNWRTEAPAAAAAHRVMLTDALAVTAWSECKSTTNVLQTLKIPVTARPVKNCVANGTARCVRYSRAHHCRDEYVEPDRPKPCLLDWKLAQIVSSDAVYTELVRPRNLSVILIGDHAYAVRGYRSGRTERKIAEANFQNAQAIPILQKRSK